ncbi:DUF2189 domain-containing protein [Paenirhodobacter sp.]|uniref:DUF2189 domain-containing protein n=1 Tax=Paenirhodobacter sp. TaxID=1965326 RepID=UPI003B3E5730
MQVVEAPSELPGIRDVPVATVPDILRRGVQDFRRAPAFGLFFSGVYVLGGIVLWWVLGSSGREWGLIPFAAGFPLLAPFAAIGLFEVSRRLERGEPLIWREVLGVVFAQKDRQLPSMAMIVLMMFMFWVFVAHTIFALFMGTRAMTNITSSPEVLLTTPHGVGMLVVGVAVGAVLAAVLFSITVIGLPLLLEREVDVVTAMITSVAAVRANPGTMLGWATTIAVLMFAAMVPMFLGLLVVLPVLGHASWHMYRAVTG